MIWSEEELQTYRDKGYVLRRSLLSAAEIKHLQKAMPKLLEISGNDGMHRECEHSGAVR